MASSRRLGASLVNRTLTRSIQSPQARQPITQIRMSTIAAFKVPTVANEPNVRQDSNCIPSEFFGKVDMLSMVILRSTTGPGARGGGGAGRRPAGPGGRGGH